MNINLFQQSTVNAVVFKLQVIYSSETLEIAIAQLCNELQVCNFTISDPKVGNNIFKLGQITTRLAFVAMYLLYKFDDASCNISRF